MALERPEEIPVATAIFRYNHIAHIYNSTDVQRRRFDLRSMAFLIMDAFPDGSTRCTFVHNGTRGELDGWYSSGVHGDGQHLMIDGLLEPLDASFSFLGHRLRLHHLMIAPLPGPDPSRRYLAVHHGRNRAGACAPIKAHTPWAILSRQTPETLGSQRRYMELLQWLRTRPSFRPQFDHRLQIIPSQL